MEKKWKRKMLLFNVILFILFIVVLFTMFRKDDEPKYVVWQTNANEAKHYSLSDSINLKKEWLRVSNFDKMSNNNGWIISIDGSTNIYDFIQSSYSFSLGYNDEMFLNIGCDYKENKIHLIYMSEIKHEYFNQIIIFENSSLNIIAVINLDENIEL